MAATILNVLHMRHLAGTERMHLQYTLMLAHAGYHVVCLVPDNARVSDELRNNPNITLVEDAGIHLNKGKLNPLRDKKYRALVKQYRPDVVITHSGGLTRLFKRVCKGLGCPVVAVNHNTNPKQSCRADYVIAASRPTYDQLIGQYAMNPDQVKLLFNFTDMPNDAPTIAPYRTPPVVGYLGRMDDNKNVETLMRALELLHQRGTDFRAVIGGDGPNRRGLEAMAKRAGLDEQITFTGWEESQYEFFSELDILVFCSYSEALPLVMLEAAKYGKPRISSNFPGADDLVQAPDTGLMYPCGDANALADAIATLLADEKQAHSMALRAYDHTREHYATHVARDQLTGFIDYILQQQSAAAGGTHAPDATAR